MADGGALLSAKDWKNNQTFATIFQRYSILLSRPQIDTVVFDGYALSTKAFKTKYKKWPKPLKSEMKTNAQLIVKHFFQIMYSNKESFVKRSSNELLYPC